MIYLKSLIVLLPFRYTSNFLIPYIRDRRYMIYKLSHISTIAKLECTVLYFSSYVCNLQSKKRFNVSYSYLHSYSYWYGNKTLNGCIIIYTYIYKSIINKIIIMLNVNTSTINFSSLDCHKVCGICQSSYEFIRSELLECLFYY